MKIAMNPTVSFNGSALTDIAVAKASGYTGIDLSTRKIALHRQGGLTTEVLHDALTGLTVTGLGAVLNLEREGNARQDFLEEVRAACKVAVEFGAPYVQLCTGPVDRAVVRDYRDNTLNGEDLRYRGTLGRTAAESLDVAAANIASSAAIARDYGIGVAVEPLAWTPVGSCAPALEAIEKSGADNVGIALDFWHAWAAGDTPETIASIPSELISTVQIADGIEFDRGREMPEQDLYRNVVLGGGGIPLQEWVDATKSTGYQGWYAPEIFSSKAKQMEYVEFATAMRLLIGVLLS